MFFKLIFQIWLNLSVCHFIKMCFTFEIIKTLLKPIATCIVDILILLVSHLLENVYFPEAYRIKNYLKTFNVTKSFQKCRLGPGSFNNASSTIDLRRKRHF